MRFRSREKKLREKSLAVIEEEREELLQTSAALKEEMTIVKNENKVL